MRRVIGWLLVVLGAAVAIPGVVAAVWVGPDDTAQTGPHGLRTTGVAIVSEAEVLRYVGPVLHLTVASADGGPVFIGVANEVDVESYLGASAHRVVSHVKLPWTIDTAEVSGSAEAVAPPEAQPWWITSVAGEGEQELAWPIPDGRYEIVALNADGSPGVDTNVTLGLEIEGTFYTLLAVATFGLLLLLLGLALLLWRRRRPAPADEAVATANTPGRVPPPDETVVLTKPAPSTGSPGSDATADAPQTQIEVER